jgi:uncharacterized sulfatase
MLLIICIAWGRTQAAPNPPTRHPNILFLLVDELRADCLGAEGHPLVKTPHLDQLGREGIRFNRAYVSAPICSPDRATLFTGRYPQSHGVVTNGLPFRAGETILPEYLRRRGYTTAMIGKLHLRKTPEWFDQEWLTTGGSGKEYQSFVRESKPGFRGRAGVEAVPETFIGPPRTPLRIGTSVLPDHLYEEAWIADKAIEFMQQQQEGSKPWFLFVSMYKPHSPYVIPEPYASMYDPHSIPLPKTFVTGTARPENNKNPRHFINDPDLLKTVAAHYYGSISMIDAHMGRILRELDKLGLRDDTIVLFTSEHGNMMGEHNRMFKGVMYEPSARVPQFLRYPKRLGSNVVSEITHDHTAIVPTLLELADLPLPEGVQGESLVRALKSGESSERPAFSVYRDRMAVIGDWKLIDPSVGTVPQVDPRPEPQLFNLKDDPIERHNLYGKPEHAGTQKRLQAAIDNWWEKTRPHVKVNVTRAD